MDLLNEVLMVCQLSSLDDEIRGGVKSDLGDGVPREFRPLSSLPLPLPPSATAADLLRPWCPSLF